MTEHRGDYDVVTAPPAAISPSPDRRKLTPKRLVVIFLAVLAGTVGGTLVADQLLNSNSASVGAMGTWMGRYGPTYLGVSHDVGTVSEDAISPNTNASTLRQDCVRLQSAVHRGQADPPMPIGELQTQWSSILGDLDNGARDCVAGLDQRNRTLLMQTQSDFANASQSYVKLIKAVQHVSG
jgi:hypothetical protein